MAGKAGRRRRGRKAKVRLLADEQVPVQIARHLRLLGFDVALVRGYCEDKAGDALSDEAVLGIGKKEKRAIVTRNRKHFLELACVFDDDDPPRQIAKAIAEEIKVAGERLNGRWVEVRIEH